MHPSVASPQQPQSAQQAFVSVLPSPTPSNEGQNRQHRRANSLRNDSSKDGGDQTGQSNAARPGRPHKSMTIPSLDRRHATGLSQFGAGPAVQHQFAAPGSHSSLQHQTQTVPALSDQRAELGSMAFSDGYPADYCLGILQNYLNSIGGSTALTDFEQSRIRLLSEACKRKDYFYLTLHQCLCSATAAPQSIPPYLAMMPNTSHAFDVLNLLLVANHRLKRELVIWFTNFPVTLSDALLRWPGMFQREMGRIRSFLVALSERWETFQFSCKRRLYPPSARELVELLGVTSILLQRVIFTGVLRSFWGSTSTEWSNKADSLFSQDQAHYYHHVASATPGADPASYNATEKFHVRLWREWWGYHQQQVSSQAASPLSAFYPMSTAHTQGQQLGSASFTAAPQQGRLVNTPRHILPLNAAMQSPDMLLYSSPANLQRRSSGSHGPSPQGPVVQPARHEHRRQSGTSALPGPTKVQHHSRDTRSPITPLSAPPSGLQRLPASFEPPGTPAQTPQQLHGRSSIIPSPRTIRPQPSNPDSVRSALHQAHLRSPILKVKTAEATPDPTKRFYQFVAGFALEPVNISLTSPINEFLFSVTASDFQTIPDDHPSNRGERPVRTLDEQSTQYRLRCSKLPLSSDPLKEHNWVVGDTFWPQFMYFRVNSHLLEVRRKLHHGKELPVDITRHVVEGENKVEVYINLRDQDRLDAQFALAVERVGLMSGDEIKERCIKHQSIRSKTVLDYLKFSLSSTAQDDELAIVSSNITIRLFDPISGTTIPETPVRGRHCLHPECFDLDTFLLTRRAHSPGSPSVVDEWRCPLCKRDVRPQNLLVDEFISEVRDKLAEQGLVHTKAIIVEQNGEWKPKLEPNGDSAMAVQENGAPTRSPSRGSAAKKHRPEPIIITLD